MTTQQMVGCLTLEGLKAAYTGIEWFLIDWSDYYSWTIMQKDVGSFRSLDPLDIVVFGGTGMKIRLEVISPRGIVSLNTDELKVLSDFALWAEEVER